MKPINNEGIKIKLSIVKKIYFKPVQDSKCIKLVKSSIPKSYNRFYDENDKIMNGKYLFVFTEKCFYFLCFKLSINVQKSVTG